MPLLLHRSPVAGRALAWRSRGRDVGAGVGLGPLAAVRHLFRDHSSGSSGGPSDGHRGHQHPHRHHPHHHPHHRKGKELSSDWPTLYLGAKLAYWSGLCYLPYDNIPQTLQEEGLQLVAYGRTSFTCWYVADGYVDFDALRRRAFSQRPQAPSPQTPQQAAQSPQSLSSQPPSSTPASPFPPAPASAPAASAAYGPNAGSLSSAVATATLAAALRPYGKGDLGRAAPPSVSQAPREAATAPDGAPARPTGSWAKDGGADGGGGSGAGTGTGTGGVEASDPGGEPGAVMQWRTADGGPPQRHDYLQQPHGAALGLSGGSLVDAGRDADGATTPQAGLVTHISMDNTGQKHSHEHTYGHGHEPRHSHEHSHEHSSAHGHAHGHAHARVHIHAHGHAPVHNHVGAPGAQGHRHVLRDGHIHLEQQSHPLLHLRRPAGSGPDIGGSSGSGSGQQPPSAQAHHIAPVVPGTRCRFIFLRGVQWAAHDINTLSLSASLAAFWPTPLLPPDPEPPAVSTGADTAATSAAAAAAATRGGGRGSSSAGSGSNRAANASSNGGSINVMAGGSGGGSSSSSLGDAPEELVAHSGVGAMARDLLPVLLPYIRGTEAAGADHLVFAGHSLGGSLAKLLWAMSLGRGHRSPDATSCHTFGSPPVLAHAGGGGGARVLRLLRAPSASVINWVLEHDPVPRAMLTADPYFAAARQAVPGLTALLALRGAVLGEGAALSSGRFLYETAGELLLLRWSSKGGCEVVPVSEVEADSLLRMALDEAVSSPVRTLQYWLDHHHASYHHDLEAAALAACRRLDGERQQARMAVQGNSGATEDPAQRLTATN